MAKEKTEKKLSFEQALEKLEAIVTRIESGETPLEESITRYEEGQKLIRQCRAILDAAEQKIQLLAQRDEDDVRPTGELPEPEGD